MAKNTQPIAKRCKALGISPAVMGYAKKNTTRNSNGNMRKKQSEYASQLKEKQKVKFIYGVLEKQFHNAYLRLRLAPARPVRTCCRSWSAVWTTSCSVWALLRPAATLVSWCPRSLHRQRQEGQHSLLPGEGRRRDRSARVQPQLCKVCKADRCRGSRCGSARMAEPRDRFSEGRCR